jgi:hypothetical protein
MKGDQDAVGHMLPSRLGGCHAEVAQSRHSNSLQNRRPVANPLPVHAPIAQSGQSFRLLTGESQVRILLGARRPHQTGHSPHLLSADQKVTTEREEASRRARAVGDCRAHLRTQSLRSREHETARTAGDTTAQPCDCGVSGSTPGFHPGGIGSSPISHSTLGCAAERSRE